MKKYILPFRFAKDKIHISNGFTLFEILIVVAIIGVLAGITLVGLAPAQRRGRDTRRVADLSHMQTSLELYYSKIGQYPVGSPKTWADLTSSLASSSIGVDTLPVDPRGTDYKYGSDGVGYVMGAILEDAGNPALSTDSDGTVYGVDCADPTYCLKF